MIHDYYSFSFTLILTYLSHILHKSPIFVNNIKDLLTSFNGLNIIFTLSYCLTVSLVVSLFIKNNNLFEKNTKNQVLLRL